MCCFSQPVISVSSTKIYARASAHGRQILVYSMALKAKDDLAMILPLPVKTPAGEKDVQFIDLKDYPTFSMTCTRAFRSLLPKSRFRSVVARCLQQQLRSWWSRWRFRGFLCARRKGFLQTR